MYKSMIGAKIPQINLYCMCTFLTPGFIPDDDFIFAT